MCHSVVCPHRHGRTELLALGKFALNLSNSSIQVVSNLKHLFELLLTKVCQLSSYFDDIIVHMILSHTFRVCTSHSVWRRWMNGSFLQRKTTQLIASQRGSFSSQTVSTDPPHHSMNYKLTCLTLQAATYWLMRLPSLLDNWVKVVLEISLL